MFSLRPCTCTNSTLEDLNVCTCTHICASVSVCVCTKSLSCVQLFETLDCSLPHSSVQRNFSGKNTGVGCHLLLQGIFLTEGSNPRLLYLLQWQGDSSPAEPWVKLDLNVGFGFTLRYQTLQGNRLSERHVCRGLLKTILG